MKRCLRLLGAALGAAALMLPARAAERLVTGGMIAGLDMADGTAFYRGIPYAAPPVGALRWQAPEPVIPWQGVRDATVPGPPCLQRSYDWNAADAAASKEDCLYLAVRAPIHGERLPVMVWIHGGANRAGSGIGYGLSSIVQRGVILVTLQYRLGVFGFLSLPALSAASPDHASGNYALMDEIAALKWVKANIASFGGDPGNVTIFGQSAGAQDVGLLMLSPLARGLFDKAIEESGTAGFGVAPRTLAENEQLGEQLETLMGVPHGAEGLAALRAAPGAALLDAADKLVPPTPDASFIWLQAVADGFVLPQTPKATILAGQEARVPLIIGNNAHELELYGAPADAIRQNFGANADAALALYGPDTPAYEIADDLTFRCPSNWIAAHQTALGVKVWRYQLGVAKAGTTLTHSSDLPFVFDEAPKDATFGTWPPLEAYWTNFAKTGNPNGPGLPLWRDWDGAANYIAFTASGVRADKDLRGPICRLLDNP